MKPHSFVSALIVTAVLAAAGMSPVCSAAEKASTAPKSSLQDELIAKENMMWTTFKDKNVDEFNSNVTADFINIDVSGLSTKTELSKAIPDYDVADFKLDDFKLIRPDKTTAILTYVVTAHYTYKGKPGPLTVYATSVWANHKGKWLTVFHQESPAAPSESK